MTDEQQLGFNYNAEWALYYLEPRMWHAFAYPTKVIHYNHIFKPWKWWTHPLGDLGEPWREVYLEVNVSTSETPIVYVLVIAPLVLLVLLFPYAWLWRPWTYFTHDYGPIPFFGLFVFFFVLPLPFLIVYAFYPYEADAYVAWGVVLLWVFVVFSYVYITYNGWLSWQGRTHPETTTTYFSPWYIYWRIAVALVVLAAGVTFLALFIRHVPGRFPNATLAVLIFLGVIFFILNFACVSVSNMYYVYGKTQYTPPETYKDTGFKFV